MKRKAIFIIAALFLIASMAAFAGGQQEEAAMEEDDGITIAYIGFPHITPFWVEMSEYVKETADSLGVEILDMTPTEADAAQQKAAVDNAINREVDGIIIGAVDNRAFGESLDRAQSRGIVCAAVDTAIDHPAISALAQTDNLASAELMGEYIVDTTEVGQVLILGGTLGHQTGNARRDGVKNVTEAAGYEVIFRACDWDDGKAYETAINELAANENIVAVFGAWDPGALAGLSAVKERGLLDEIKVYGFDGLPGALKAIEEGEMTATVKQDNRKMADVVVKSVVNQIQGETSVETLLIEGIIVDEDNVDEFM
jgi:ribose transport system substrate-binding protein